MATTWPKNFPGVGTTAENVAKDITKASGGRLEIKVYGSGEIVPAYEVFEAVRQNTVEIGHGWSGYWISKHPGLAYLGGIPGGHSPSEQSSWILHGGGQKLWEDLWKIVPNMLENIAQDMGISFHRFFIHQVRFSFLTIFLPPI